jgi:hypothetical protein
MDTLKAELAEFQTARDLKPILAADGPCLSVYIQLSSASPAQSAKTNALEWKKLTRDLEAKIEQFGAQGRELLSSISEWDSILQWKQPQARSIAVFRSPEIFRAAWLDGEVTNRAFAGPRFHIRPLLPDVTHDREFYILALSQKNVRLLHCTKRTSEEVPLPNGYIPNYEAWMNSAKPDHLSDDRASAGPGSGHSKGVMFTTSSDREDKGEYLAHFFRQIDRGVDEVLRGSKPPLVLCAVEYELSLYRSLSSYPNLAKEDVQGAPNSLKSGEMHARALDALARCYKREIGNKLVEWNHKAGGGASNRLKEVLRAAYDGRVVTLLVSDSLESTGTFDQATHTAHGRESGTPNDEDLVNDAAVQTLLHGGQVLVAPNSKMPNGAPLAAIYRF